MHFTKLSNPFFDDEAKDKVRALFMEVGHNPQKTEK